MERWIAEPIADGPHYPFSTNENPTNNGNTDMQGVGHDDETGVEKGDSKLGEKIGPA